MASDRDGTAGRYALVLDRPPTVPVDALFAGQHVDGLRFDSNVVDGAVVLNVDTGTTSPLDVLPDVLTIVGLAGSAVVAVREIPADVPNGPRRRCAEALTLIVLARNGHAAI